MTMNLKCLYNSKKGKERDKNQDGLFISDKKDCVIFVVFDGVSSYEHSYKFVNAYKKVLKGELSKNYDVANLCNAFHEAHNKVLKFNIDGKSTMSALVLDKETNNKRFVSIGDSRIYVFTKQYIQQITNDDLLVGSSNIVTRCLGMNELSKSDFEFTNIKKGSNFLICTDGFYSLMEDNVKDYFNALNYAKSTNIKKKLSALQRRKNTDDSTYIIVKNSKE